MYEKVYYTIAEIKEPMMRFILRGQGFDVSMSDVIRTAKKIQPGSIQKYSVRIDGINYPIRQVLAEVTGLKPIEITSQDAYRLLTRLGFPVHHHR
jgi:hypothetical protein